MDNILNVLFDYQRFNENSKLQKIIDDVVDKYSSKEEVRAKIMPFRSDLKKDS
ncbi:MAG: hypothetical protein K6B41_08785 [Butyrivibrio sp.]|nr:hypothetical protein [Butyrivibrio sp.]